MKTKHIITTILFSALLLGNASMIKGSNPAANANSLSAQAMELFQECELRMNSLSKLKGRVDPGDKEKLTKLIVGEAEALLSGRSEKNLNSIENACAGITFLERFYNYSDDAHLQEQLVECYSDKLMELISTVGTLDITQAFAGERIKSAFRAFVLLQGFNKYQPYLNTNKQLLEAKNGELEALYTKELPDRNSLMNLFDGNLLTIDQAQTYHKRIANNLGFIDRFCERCTHTITTRAKKLISLDEDEKKEVSLASIENACAGLWIIGLFENTLGNKQLAADDNNFAIELIQSFKSSVINPVIEKAISSSELETKDDGMRALALIESFFAHPDTNTWIKEQRAAIYPAKKGSRTTGSTTGSTPNSQSGSNGKPKTNKSAPSRVKSSKTSWFTLKRLLLIGGSLTIATLLGAAAYQKYGKKNNAGTKPQKG